MADFYTNVCTLGKYILFRGVENDRRIRRKIQFNPTFYLPSQEQSEFRTLDGSYVKPVQPGTIPECREFLKRYENVDNFPIFGNNRFDYAYIADEYPDDILWDVDKILVAYLDIEVGSENGFPEPRHANEAITAISIKVKGNYFVFGVGDYSKHRDDVHYAHCRDESDLIRRFLDLWTRWHPDVITGWNVQFFDIPYLVNRITKLFGEDEAKKLSSWKKLSEREVIIRNRKEQTYDILGSAILDYLELYKKFTYSQQESYRLDHIAHVELGEKKIDYSEFETLHQLYKLDYQKFIEYNIKDVELVEKLEDKMRLIELALTLAYDNKVNFDDVFTQVRMWDAIVYNYLKKKNIVIPQMSRGVKNSQYEGAYVKDPILGMHQWIVSFDLTSLYPSLIMMYNISPETKVQKSSYNNEMLNLSAAVSIDSMLNKQLDFKNVLVHNNMNMTPNGSFYSHKILGCMPAIVNHMFQDRKRYKKLMLEAEKELQLVDAELNKRS
jgi:DNA polymerase elongation subunit (family B)